MSSPPFKPKYHIFPLYALVHRILNTAEMTHSNRRIKNSMSICVLVSLSKVDLFKGAVVVLFCISFVSCPV